MKAKVEGEQSWRRPKLNNFQNFKILKLLDRKRTFRHSAQRRGLLDLNGPSIGRGGEAFFEILSQLIGFGPSRQNVSVTSVVELEEAEFISNFLNNPYSDPESMNLDFFSIEIFWLISQIDKKKWNRLNVSKEIICSSLKISKLIFRIHG